MKYLDLYLSVVVPFLYMHIFYISILCSFTVPTPPPCPDLDPSCHLWKAYCTHNDYVREHCFNSCNNCTNAVHGEAHHMRFGHGFHH